MLSSYLPPEFFVSEKNLGVTLTATNITPTSLTLKCMQSSVTSKRTATQSPKDWIVFSYALKNVITPQIKFIMFFF